MIRHGVIPFIGRRPGLDPIPNHRTTKTVRDSGLINPHRDITTLEETGNIRRDRLATSHLLNTDYARPLSVINHRRLSAISRIVFNKTILGTPIQKVSGTPRIARYLIAVPVIGEPPPLRPGNSMNVIRIVVGVIDKASMLESSAKHPVIFNRPRASPNEFARGQRRLT